MKSRVFFVALLIAAPAAATAAAQSSSAGSSTPASGAPASAPAAATVLNGDSPIEAIAAVPAGRASLERNIPELLPHQAYQQFKTMSLRQLAPLSGGIITDEKIAAIEADLRASQ